MEAPPKMQKISENIEKEPNYNHSTNPFNQHFHSQQANFPFNQKGEKKLLFEPNQIEFPKEIDPKHQGLVEDIAEFKHFRNIIATFLNYKVFTFIFPTKN